MGALLIFCEFCVRVLKVIWFKFGYLQHWFEGNLAQELAIDSGSVVFKRLRNGVNPARGKKPVKRSKTTARRLDWCYSRRAHDESDARFPATRTNPALLVLHQLSNCANKSCCKFDRRLPVLHKWGEQWKEHYYEKKSQLSHWQHTLHFRRVRGAHWVHNPGTTENRLERLAKPGPGISISVVFHTGWHHMPRNTNEKCVARI